MKQTTYLATLPQVNALIEQGFEPASDIGPCETPMAMFNASRPGVIGFYKTCDMAEQDRIAR